MDRLLGHHPNTAGLPPPVPGIRTHLGPGLRMGAPPGPPRRAARRFPRLPRLRVPQASFRLRQPPRIPRRLLAPNSSAPPRTRPRRYAPGTPPPAVSLASKGMLLPWAVLVSAVPWATPCAPPPDPLLQPAPAFIFSLPDPLDQAATPLRDTSLTWLTHNWGGISGHVSLARTWLKALSFDVIAEQQLWDTAAARPALRLRYEAHYGAASGQGSGLRIACLRSLRAPCQPADLVYDSPYWMASAVPLSLGGRALLFNAHLRPRLSYSDWLSEVKLMNHLRARMRSDLCVLLGDLNSTGAPGTPLASTFGALGPLSSWHRLIPPATPTNFTTRHGAPRATAIDHIFDSGPIASHTHHVLPCHTSHAMVLAQVALHHRSYDADSWRLF